ncbi:DUF3027 domain-containing protein [Corynebacterium guangdongense]|uniref:DUF3027 domain-containing protein n=1 Tax=Corynebacterium guangdongense TaxID=1783348 RepID=UPI0025B5F56D|nr:DUF3027 domain-containing protein [Corynebacterium guangdongense]WJZ17359.1 hypothetical protein CGUA_03835 [Corynebacterium guangdongense]
MAGVSSSRRNSTPSSRGSGAKNNPLLSSRAVGIARAALEELGEGEVGEHIGVAGMSRNVATHRFAADLPGYPGWEWNAVLACASGSTWITVNEVALVPAPNGEALQAPEWVPYADRVRPGDLGPGDLMPPAPDDVRLTDDPSDPRAVELVAGADLSKRTNYLTTTGLREAVDRWRTGDYGPTSEFAEKARLHCRTCAFFLPVDKPIGPTFGVCANEFSADGILVHATYGCGAHSQTQVQETDDTGAAQVADVVYDDERPIF